MLCISAPFDPQIEMDNCRTRPRTVGISCGAFSFLSLLDQSTGTTPPTLPMGGGYPLTGDKEKSTTGYYARKAVLVYRARGVRLVICSGQLPATIRPKA